MFAMGMKQCPLEFEPEPEHFLADTEDRRGNPRMRTVYRVAIVRARDDQGLARVRNISDSGMRLTIGIAVVKGDLLEISLSDTFVFHGHIVWVENGECGVQFAKAIDSVSALRITAEEALTGNVRPPRLSTTQPAVVATEHGLRVTQLYDVSQRGVKIADDGHLSVGLSATVTISPTIERKGYVRWVRNGYAGLILTEPLTVGELGSVKGL